MTGSAFFLKANTNEKHYKERKHNFDLCSLPASVPRIASNEGVINAWVHRQYTNS